MDPRQEQRIWLSKVLDRTGLAPTALAQRANLAPTTLTRFLNDPDHSTALSARTISAVEKVTGLRFGEDPRLVGFHDGEAEPFKPEDTDDRMMRAFGNAYDRTNGIDPWRLRSRALEIAGYLPGDILVVDLNASPQPGDIVCAQVYDWAKVRAETVFRLWEPPSLIAATMEPSLRKPFLVDQQNVVIKGVVCASWRQLHAPSSRAHRAA